MEILMRGYGKIILFGEHAVVYGYPALAASIDLGIDASVKSSDDKFMLSIPSCEIRVCSDENHLLAQVYRNILGAFNKYNHNKACEIELQTEIPLGAGLGSSAATSVAITRALDSWFQSSLSNEKINEIAFAAETIFHGTPSGIDNTIATFGGFCHLRDANLHPCPQQAIKELYLKKLTVSFLPRGNHRISVLIVNTKKERKTKKMVARVRSLVDRSPEKYHNIMQKIGVLPQLGYEAILQNDLISLGELMSENQNYLSLLNVSCPEIDDICMEATKNGALGAKLTGAGGGGCVVVLTKKNPDLEKIYREKGFNCFYTNLG